MLSPGLHCSDDSRGPGSKRGPELRLIDAKVTVDGTPKAISGHGNGPIAGYVEALAKDCGIKIRVRDYHQHATGAGEDAQAVSYIEAETAAGKVEKPTRPNSELPRSCLRSHGHVAAVPAVVSSLR